jgi:hypothetical protein
MLISAIRYSKSIKSSPKCIHKRCYKNLDSDLFVQAVQQLSWLDVYDDMDDDVGLLTRKITGILDDMAPMKRIQDRTNYSPWISKETIITAKESICNTK